MTDSDPDSKPERPSDSPPKPRTVSYAVWHALRELSAVTTTLHKLDQEYPSIAAKEAKEHLETAKESIEDAIEQLDEVIEHHEDAGSSEGNTEDQ